MGIEYRGTVLLVDRKEDYGDTLAEQLKDFLQRNRARTAQECRSRYEYRTAYNQTIEAFICLLDSLVKIGQQALLPVAEESMVHLFNRSF